MSVVPKKRTKILVKDLIFQEKYNLSHTQTDLMAYLSNLVHWAISVDGYFVLTTSKIMSDLPQMGQKTFEASLKVLKDLELIECKLVEVKEWKGKPKLRGIKLTQKGKEYNSNLVLPTQDEKKRELEETIKKLKETIAKLETEKEQKEEPKEKTPQKETSKAPKKDELNNFRDKIVQSFGDIGKPICNMVPNYQNKTTFYINSYKKLSLITPQNDYIQLEDPKRIYEFWKWLYQNQNRVGDIIDFDKYPTLEELKKRYTKKSIQIKGKTCTIIDFVPKSNKVKIKVKVENKINFLIDSTTQKEALFDLDECQNIILRLLR